MVISAMLNLVFPKEQSLKIIFPLLSVFVMYKDGSTIINPLLTLLMDAVTSYSSIVTH